MSLKKLLCNPPAERMAESGDPVVLGMFEGAGDGVYKIEDEKLRAQFVHAVADVEKFYVDARKKLAAEVEEEMNKIFVSVLG